MRFYAGTEDKLNVGLSNQISKDFRGINEKLNYWIKKYNSELPSNNIWKKSKC
jgi:hypothetical protein